MLKSPPSLGLYYTLYLQVERGLGGLVCAR